FERGRISWGEVERTRETDRWIAEEWAPAAMRAWGEALAQGDARRTELQEARENPNDDAELERLKEQAEALAVPGYSAKLARTVHETSTGEGDWEALRATDLGWAAKPLWGYGNLEIRLPARAKAGEPPLARKDLDGDGEPDEWLDRYVDQNRDGRPDPRVTDSTVDVGRLLRIPAQFQIIFAIAPCALGAGFITGRPGLMVLAGGILAYFVLGPTAYAMGWLPGVRAPD